MQTTTVPLPALVKFYVNGSRVTRQQAKDFLAEAADRQGYESGNWEHAWATAHRSEECRDFLNELSGYALEIMVDD